VCSPITLETGTAEEQFANLLAVLDDLESTHLIFTKANADTDGRIINAMIDEYVKKRREKSIAFTSLGQLRYLSAIQYVDGVVGNSSSGLLEVPSFKIGTVNIGDRQRGRVKAKSVIDCKSTKDEIGEAIFTLFSTDFREGLDDLKNPYGSGGASKQIARIISEYPLDGILKKPFFDVGKVGLKQ